MKNENLRNLLNESKIAVFDLGTYTKGHSIFDSIIDEVIITIPNETLDTIFLIKINPFYDYSQEEIKTMVAEVAEYRKLNSINLHIEIFETEEELVNAAHFYLSALEYDINYNGNVINMEYMNFKFEKNGLDRVHTECKPVNLTGVFLSPPSLAKHSWIKDFKTGTKILSIGLFENLSTALLYQQLK